MNCLLTTFGANGFCNLVHSINKTTQRNLHICRKLHMKKEKNTLASSTHEGIFVIRVPKEMV